MSTTTIPTNLYYCLLAFPFIAAVLFAALGIALRIKDLEAKEWSDLNSRSVDRNFELQDKIDKLEDMNKGLRDYAERVRKMETALDYTNKASQALEEIKTVAKFVNPNGIFSPEFTPNNAVKKKLSSMSTDEVRAIYQDPKASEFEHEAAWMELTSRRGQLSDRGVASYSSGRPGMVPI